MRGAVVPASEEQAGTERTRIIISAARACLGTPFIHQGRVPGVGLDCAGLIVIAARAAGITLHTPHAYAYPAAGDQVVDYLGRQLAPASCVIAGTVLLFRLGGQPQHLALATSDSTMIHAYAPAGRVVETTIGTAWLGRLIGIYTFTE